MAVEFFKKLNKKKIIISIICLALLIALIAWIVWGNMSVKTVSYDLTSEKVSTELDGFNIVQISDFHNAEFSNNNSDLVNLVKGLKPEIIVITGDLIDSRKTNVEISVEFTKKLVELAPCYFVAGNHEARTIEYQSLRTQLINLGVKVLKDDFDEITVNGSKIVIYGIEDPDFVNQSGDQAEILRQKLNKFTLSDGYNILLSHRPEAFSLYCEYGFDLVFSGHAHGGQFYLPLIGGVAAPHQGLFPKYDKGKFVSKNTVMIVSGGLGNSIFPFRVNNRPEIIDVIINN